MPGNYDMHVERFGFCMESSHSGIEMMDLEVEDDYGRFRVKKMPACSTCYGLK